MSEAYTADHPVMVWFRAAPRAGELPPGADVHAVEARSPADGAVLRLCARVAGGCLQAVRFRAHGCPATIACGAWLAEQLEGQPVTVLHQVSAMRISEALQLPATRRHSAVLAETAAADLARAVAGA